MAIDTEKMLAGWRKRTAGAVLGFCERSDWYSTLDRDEKDALRDKVLSALATYHDVVLETVRALDGTGALNDRTLELIQELHGAVVLERPAPQPRRQQRALAAGQ